MYKTIILKTLLTIIISFTSIIYAESNYNEINFLDRNDNLIPLNQSYQDIEYNEHYIEENENNTILLVLLSSWIPETQLLLRKLDNLSKDFRKLNFTIIVIYADYPNNFKEINDLYKNLKFYSDNKNNISKHMNITYLPNFYIIYDNNEKLVQILGIPNFENNKIRNKIYSYIEDKKDQLPKNTYDKSKKDIIIV